MRGEYAITKEEIAKIREAIQLGDVLKIEQRSSIDKRGHVTVKKYQERVLEKTRHFVVCEYVWNGNKLLESILYVQLIQGDGAWLV